MEADIIKGLKVGSDVAYRHLYEHYYKMLCVVAFGYVKDLMSSEMIVSDVIFAIWQNRESIEINLSLRKYLVQAVRNRSINYLVLSERQQELQHRNRAETNSNRRSDE